MNELAVDPALYRLRAFEVDWIQPLSGSLRKRKERAGGGLLLTSVLLAEAKRWLSMGQRVGYFAEVSVSDTPRGADFDESAYFDDDTETLMTNPRIFAFALQMAQEDLTPARKTLMRLLHFADDPDWELNLRQASALAEDLARRPWLTLPPEQVDGLAWCLDGADMDASKELPLSPADWRIRRIRSETAAARWRALQEVRTAIAAPMHVLDVDKNTPPELRVAAEMQMRREVALSPDADPISERMAWEQLGN